MRKALMTLAVLTAAAMAVTAAESTGLNTVTAAETAGGWRLLFDGKTTTGWSDAWKAQVAKSKFHEMPRYGLEKTGYIALQDHEAEVAFRNIKIKVLD